jgi:uncharacterized membrane protein
MDLTPLHVIGGATAIVSGFAALAVRKGTGRHRTIGTIFVYAMLVMSLSGAVIAIGRDGAALNVPAGLVTAYLVLSSLLTVRARSAGSRLLERAAMFGAFAVGLASLALAVASGASGKAGLVFPLVMFGTLALSGGAGDWRMIRAGGLQGTARLTRHLWRMCVALFIAAASFFLGPAGRIPEPLRLPALRLVPPAALAIMLYWLWRLRRRGAPARVAGATAPAGP